MQTRTSRNTSPQASHLRKEKAGDGGFSLLELMVVVVILSILALVIVPRARTLCLILRCVAR